MGERRPTAEERKTANDLGRWVGTLHLAGVLTDGEAERANRRLLKWAAERGITMRRRPMLLDKPAEEG